GAERELPPRRPALLVAGGAALAVAPPLAGLDGAPLSAPGHAALRRALGLPRLLRSDGLRGSAVGRGARAAPRRSGARRRPHVGLGDAGLPRAGSVAGATASQPDAGRRRSLRRDEGVLVTVGQGSLPRTLLTSGSS